NLDEALVKYRLHPASATYSAANVKRGIFEQVLADADRRRGRVVERTPLTQGTGQPLSAQGAPWAWCRTALSAGNYRGARILARKAAAGGWSRAGAMTFGLAMLGPAGRALLKLRRRNASTSA